MHVKAFFEYLMNITNDYWTKIPHDPNPVSTPIRDGVAVEDDMALRALLPHIRPKRGRKRPEADDVGASPAQKQRLSPQSAVEDYRQAPQDPWSGHPDGRASAVPTSRPHTLSSWSQSESLQTPVGRWPQSAATPTTRGSFWDDALEPQSAAAPSKSKLASHRRGAKNVSSAWKTAGQDPAVRSRGRPPINRTPVEEPGQHPMQNWPPSTQEGSPGSAHYSRPHLSPHPHSHEQYQTSDGHHSSNGHSTTPEYRHGGGQQTDQQHFALDESRPSRPNISLQVPDRPGSSVRLATPPLLSAPQQPAATTGPPLHQHHQADVPMNGSHMDTNNLQGDDSKYQDGWRKFAKEATDAYEQDPASMPPPVGGSGSELPDFYFEKMEDRTNVDPLVAYFTQSMNDSEWLDVHGNPTEPAGIEESTAMVHAMLQTMYKTSTSSQAFLINLAALAGSTTLVTSRPKCTRLSEDDKGFTYKCEWEYRFGNVKGGFTFEQNVPQSMWKLAKGEIADVNLPATGGENPSLTSAEHWKQKYQGLMDEMKKRDKEMADLRSRVMGAFGRDWMH